MKYCNKEHKEEWKFVDKNLRDEATADFLGHIIQEHELGTITAETIDIGYLSKRY